VSGTLGVSRVNVRRLINDLPASGSPMIGDERLTAIINSVYAQVGAILGFADTWTTSAIALVAGQREYTLPGSEYQNVSMLRRTEDGLILAKRSMIEIEARYQSTAAHPGNPVDYTLYEDGSGNMMARLYPTPDLSSASHLDVFSSVSVTPLSLPSDVIAFSRLGVQAVELLSAADCIMGIDPELMATKHISPALAQQMIQRGTMMLDTEKERRSQFRRQDTVRRMRF